MFVPEISNANPPIIIDEKARHVGNSSEDYPGNESGTGRIGQTYSYSVYI